MRPEFFDQNGWKVEVLPDVWPVKPGPGKQSPHPVFKEQPDQTRVDDSEAAEGERDHPLLIITKGPIRRHSRRKRGNVLKTFDLKITKGI